MNIKIKNISHAETDAWDTYVSAHPKATLYHLSTWKSIIEKTYSHKTYYLMAVNSSQLKGEDPSYSCRTQSSKKDVATAYQLSAKSHELNIVGILPLIYLKHFIFGNSLISIPFFDIGGILADDEETEKALLSEAIKLGQELKANNIELRHIQPLSWLGDSSQLTADSSKLKTQNSKEEPKIDYEPSAMPAQCNPVAIPSGSYDLGCKAAPELCDEVA